jgi:plastocyanin
MRPSSKPGAYYCASEQEEEAMSEGRRGMRLVLFVVVLGLLTFACGSVSKRRPTVSPSAAVGGGGLTSGQPSGGPYDYGNGSGGGTPAATVPNTVYQGTGGLVFSPAKVSIRRNTKLIVSNVAYIQHTFTIPGKGIDALNDPGEFQTVTINLPPGTYTFVCTIHRSQGMKGVLTVTA